MTCSLDMAGHPAKAWSKRYMTALLATAIFASGITFGTTFPYASIVGIEYVGLSAFAYAVLVSVGAVMSAAVSVIFGYLSDRIADRRFLMLTAAVFGAVGYGLIYFFPTPLVFSIAVGLVIPIGASTFSQSFAYARAYYSDGEPKRGDFYISCMRTVFSASFVIVPPVAGWVAANFSVFNLYAAASAAYVFYGLTYLLTLLVLPVAVRQDGRGNNNGKPALARARLSLSSLIGIIGVLLLTLAMRLIGISMPLAIVNDFGGTISDVGWYAGLSAALEIPFMLMWTALANRLSKEVVLSVCGLLFGVYVYLASFADTVMFVFWLMPVNGIAVAGLLTTNLSYLQGAIKGRIGLSTSLVDVVTIASTLLSAAIFAIFGSSQEYVQVFSSAGACTLLGALLMIALAVSDARSRSARAQ